MAQQIIQFFEREQLAPPARQPFGVATTPEIDAMLLANTVVSIGVSGGKDSVATALRLDDYLREIGHTGPKLLIHSDLGSVEWQDSLPACERLARRIGWELVVVQRAAGDLMARWEKRWENNVQRYRDLSCVKMILPWSTPSMRFCTSELKTEIICAELTKRFPGQRILSVTGVRHDESATRAKMPVISAQPKLTRRGASGWNWNPIIQWPTEDVFTYLAAKGEALHEAYTRYGSTRVSCTFCIMGSIADLRAAVSCEDNHDIYRRMVDLEIRSTYGLQGSRWLADVAPHLLSPSTREAVTQAKERAIRREMAEARLPKHLLFTKGWPTVMPSADEAALLASIRQEVAKIMDMPIDYTEPDAIIARYQMLMDGYAAKQAPSRRGGAAQQAPTPTIPPVGSIRNDIDVAMWA